MDRVTLTLGSSSSRTSHHSDATAFTIKPYGVAPPVPELSLSMIGGIALAVANVLLISYGIATILTPET